MAVSLSWKINLIIIISSLLLFAIAGVFNYSRVENSLIQIYTDQIKINTQNLTASIKKTEDLNNEKELLQIIHKNIWLNPQIIEMKINIPEGGSVKTIASNKQESIKTIANAHNTTAINENTIVTNIYTVNNEKILEVIAPINVPGKTIGTYEVIYSLKNLSETIWREFIYSTIEFLISIILFTGLIALMMQKFIIKPINEINVAIDAVNKGNLDVKVNIKSKDEFRTLSETFNSMTLKLKELTQNLEEKVKEKTEELSSKVKESQEQNRAIIGLLEDVEASRNEAEEEKAKDEALLGSIGDSVVATDASGKIIFMNKQAENSLGWQLKEASGKIWESEIPIAIDLKNNKIEDSELVMHKVLKTKQKEVGEYYYTRKDGSKFFAGVTAAPYFLNGNIGGIVVVIRDITKEKDIDRMKTEFISLASHQLRTPLSAIRWFSEMLLDGDAGKLKTEQKEFVQNISDSNDRMIALVNALLNISRIESGRIIIEPTPTDLGKLVNTVIKELEPKIKNKKHQMIISIHPGLPQINVDQKLITEVYVNLLTNAIKYTPDGGEISVYVSKTDTDIISQVRDTGYGIPKKEQGRVFEKFYRGENIIPVETDGTGLGLYLIKAILESSGGKIWFESEEGKGTTFWFSLPLSGSIAKKGEVRINS